MRFIYPEFLAALAFISIPILIHLLHFKRYKTVYFSQVSFLKAVKEEAKKKNNLKQLLILMSRILTIITLVLVFSQPYLPVNKQIQPMGRQLVGLYIDNSFSMQTESANGILLEQAKNKALHIADSYEPGTSFLLLTNQNSPSQQQLIGKTQLLNRLSSIKESPGSNKLSEAYQRLQNNLNKQTIKAEKIIYLVSDFQDYTTDLSELKEDPALNTFLIPVTTEISNNLFIDSCWFETPGHKKNREEKLFVRIRNSSNQSYQNIPVRLKINDTIKSINNLTIEPNTGKELELVYKNNQSGTHRGIVELDDYPIVYDNRYYFSYDVRDKNHALAIFQDEDESTRKLEALFEADENIQFDKVELSKIQVSQFQNYQCIYLLNLNDLSSGLINALNQFIQNGGTLAIFPGSNIKQTAYNQLYAALKANLISGIDTSSLKMKKVNYNHPVLQDVFLREKQNLNLPYVKHHYRYSKKTETTETSIIKFNNKQSAVSAYSSGQGRLYNFSFPLSDQVTDFSQHAIFVPLVYNIALNSFAPQEIQYEISNNMVLILPLNESISSGQDIRIRLIDSKETIRLSLLNQYTDQLRIDLQNTIHKAGFYVLHINGEMERTLAFNYNRQESLSPKLNTNQLEKSIQNERLSFEVIDSTKNDFEERILKANEGIELWHFFLMLGLIFIAAEVAIIRFWK